MTQVRSYSEPCPRCEALPGEPCWAPSWPAKTRRVHYTHAARRRAVSGQEEQ